MNKKCHLFSLTEAVGSRFFQGDFQLWEAWPSYHFPKFIHEWSFVVINESRKFSSIWNQFTFYPQSCCWNSSPSMCGMHKQSAVNRDANSWLSYCLCNILSLQICSNIFNFSLLICLSHFLLYSSVPLFLRSPHFSWLHFFHFFTSYLMENVDCLKSTMRL